MANKAVTERLRKLQERTKKAEYIDPVQSDGEMSFVVKEWFDEIRTSSNKAVSVERAIAYYRAAVEDGKQYVVPKGNLQTLIEQLPGITFFYSNILIDCQQSRKYVQMLYEKKLAETKRYLMIDQEAISKYGQLKVSEVNSIANADEGVQELADLERRLAHVEHLLVALTDVFDNLKYTYNHLVTIRKEGLEEVWIDPTEGV